jgi:hypothetical protein
MKPDFTGEHETGIVKQDQSRDQAPENQGQRLSAKA